MVFDADYFYDKTCTIDRPTVSKVDLTTKKTFTTIYTTIPCSFWAVKPNNFSESKGAVESDQRKYTANLPWSYTSVKAGDRLTLFDSGAENIGVYIVLDVIKYPDLNNDIDNVALTVGIWDG